MSGLSSFFSLFWFLHLRRIATLDSAFFFWRVCFHFYFCSVVGGELLIDDQQWQRTPLFCFFLGFFFRGRTINGPLSWLMNDCPSTVRPPAGAVDVTVVDVCLFFCHLFGFPDFPRPLFFFVTAGYRLEIGFTRSYFCFRSLDFVLLEFNGIQRLYPYYLCFDSISLTLMKRFIWLDWLSLDSTRFNRLLLAFTGIE